MAATNASYIPSSADLLMVVPRLAHKIADLALGVLPDNLDTFIAKIRGGGSIIAEATPANTMNSTALNSTTAFAQHASNLASTATAAAAAAMTAAAAATADQGGFMSYLTAPFNADTVRGFGGIFTYLASRWALTTFTLSILLNRTVFYASSRQNLALPWRARLFLYSGPILFLLLHVVYVLQALKCQTSPDYPLLRYRDPAKRLPISFGGDGGLIYRLASFVLSWRSDADCCAAVDMALIGNDKLGVMGSYALIWPIFLSLCFSQFVETMSCALQGRQVMPETGMTLFELSLSFAECESIITNALGLDSFGASRRTAPSFSRTAAAPESTASASPLFTKAMLLKRMNAPPEVLLICLISCLSHLSSAVLAVSGQRDRFRLANTAVWAICYMSAFVWSFAHLISSQIDDLDDLGILRFPTVCIIGFIPHILIILGISVCAAIYAVALVVTAMSLPAEMAANPTMTQRFRLAYSNLQANVQFSSASSIKLNWSEDFYTTLLKLGFSILTAASEAVYLNEGSKVRVHQMTWIEQKRLDELASRVETRRKVQNIPAELLGERIAKGLDFTDTATSASQSGFARERKSKSGPTTAKSPGTDNGLGIAERRGRWQLTYRFVTEISRLLARVTARFTMSCLGMFGVQQVPNWLRRAADYLDGDEVDATTRRDRAETPDFWLVSDDGTLSIPENGNVDVEVEMRRRLRAVALGVDPSDEAVDADLYSWWKQGGWWGDVDKSGEYVSRSLDEDATSVISFSSTASSVVSSDDESGRRTPTQDDFVPHSREDTPEHTLGLSDLARLLDPKSTQDREEAQMLSRRLQSDRPMTRSQYRRRLTRDRTRLITGSLNDYDAPSNDLSTEDEEEAALEHFILERRAALGGDKAKGGSWDSGAEGMGSSGPQCVVCQSNPRVIMVWPCGCLSICDDCRVGVATRNFSNCMTCRTTVTAYSRLYVP